MVAVLLVSSDLLVSSRVRMAAQQAGTKLTIVPAPSDLAGRLSADTRLVIFDLAQPGLDLAAAIAAVRAGASSAHVAAFGPHVDAPLLAAASEAGCDTVLTSGEFHRGQVVLMQQYCGKAAGDAE